MVLPVATLVVAVTPYVSRIVRATLLEVLDSDYVELARLKGIPEPVVMRKHALLNAIVPGIQVIALQLAWLAGGVVLVETLFAYPGVGRQLVDSVRNHDVPMVQALSMIIAAVYIVVNLVADVLSILLTPRARTAISS
jgi:peptide/nickel transport system permease protein